MGIAESALAQHRADIAAIIAEAPGKMRVDGTVIDVAIDIPSASQMAAMEGVISPITFTVIGPSQSLPRRLILRDYIEIMPFGEAGYAGYYVEDFRMDSVEFLAMVSTAKTSNNAMKVSP